jgi:transposase
MKSKDYTDLLEDVFIPFFEDLDEDLVFQQDNASIHGSKLTTQWFQLKEIELLSWPSRSPDLNLIENLWRILASKVYANGRQFASMKELKARIKTCWEEIEVAIAMIKKLVDSICRKESLK